ncbi:nadh-glutamate synthase small chain [Nannochloropsis gaditana]|uniref:Nadh-glutamate synthase small chain n=1 Tax=Nannochloropsis gaditana TaxID=72520 RepID=W7U1X1_9STRA|nr:nadh-glutamate synthase small chain [Nannochloropsis gaditana]
MNFSRQRQGSGHRERGGWPADLVILAMGFMNPESTIPSGLSLDVDQRHNIRADYGDYRTNVDGVFAAGDCRRGQSLVVWAINEGRGVAESVNKFLIEKSEVTEDEAYIGAIEERGRRGRGFAGRKGREEETALGGARTWTPAAGVYAIFDERSKVSGLFSRHFSRPQKPSRAIPSLLFGERGELGREEEKR